MKNDSKVKNLEKHLDCKDASEDVVKVGQHKIPDHDGDDNDDDDANEDDEKFLKSCKDANFVMTCHFFPQQDLQQPKQKSWKCKFENTKPTASLIVK